MLPPFNTEPSTITLAGFVEELDVRALGATIRSRTERLRGQSHAIDCSAVTGFSGAALTELARLILDVRGAGSRLALVHLDRRVGASVPERLVEAFLLPALRKYTTPTPVQIAGRLRPSAN